MSHDGGYRLEIVSGEVEFVDVAFANQEWESFPGGTRSEIVCHDSSQTPRLFRSQGPVVFTLVAVAARGQTG